MSFIRSFTPLLLIAAFALGACTPAVTVSPSPVPTSAAATPVGPSDSLGASGPGGSTFAVEIASSELGEFLTGESGLTLYVFAPDGPNVSTCVEACADTWPPFLVNEGDEVLTGEGVSGPIGTFARADGTLQVSYDSAPLYYFVGDAEPGDTSGQGIDGTWTVAPAAPPAP